LLAPRSRSHPDALSTGTLPLAKHRKTLAGWAGDAKRISFQVFRNPFPLADFALFPDGVGLQFALKLATALKISQAPLSAVDVASGHRIANFRCLRTTDDDHYRRTPVFGTNSCGLTFQVFLIFVSLVHIKSKYDTGWPSRVILVQNRDATKGKTVYRFKT